MSLWLSVLRCVVFSWANLRHKHGKKKHKNKQNYPQKQKPEAPLALPLIDGEGKQNLNTDPATNTTNKTSENKPESFRSRLWQLIKSKSSFAEWCIVLFTGVLAGSAIYQFIIMRGQLDQMQNTNRPYIFTLAKFSFMQMPTPETIKEIPVTVYMLNVGVSPALKTRNSEPIVGLDTDSEVIEHGRKCSFTYPEGEGVALPPSQSFTTGAGITAHTITRTLSEDERKDVVVNKTKHLIVLGGVKYAGVRAGDYETTYCYIWNPDSLNGHTFPWSNCGCNQMK